MIMKTKSGQDVEISLLALEHAHAFAPLLAGYAQALKRGAPRRPDDFYAEQLLQDKRVQIIGAWLTGELAGFAIFYDLPEPLTGLRVGQVDHIHVHHAWQGKGVATAMVEALCRQAAKRSWARLILNAPRVPGGVSCLFDQLATRSDTTSYIIDFE